LKTTLGLPSQVIERYFYQPGTPKENLKALNNAIAEVYASTLNPDALLYRRSKGLRIMMNAWL
jgi:hypothetical protein